MRVGRVSKLVEDRFGKKASNVISNLLNLGHTRIADFKDAYFPPETDSDDESDDEIVNGAGVKRKRPNGTEAKENGVVNGVPANDDDAKPSTDSLMNEGGPVNGVSEAPKLNGKARKEEKIDSHQGSTISEAEDEIANVDELYDTIRLLMERGWIRIVTDDQYLSPGDVHTIKQQEAINNVNGGAAVTGTKDKEKVHRETLRLKREMRDAWSDVPKLTRKRQTEDSHYNGTNKRQKINGVQSRSAAVTSSPEDELVIRVNPEKISVAMRTEQLVQLVEQRIGQVTAQVYRAMLRVLEENISRCYEEWPEPPLPVGNGEVVADNHIDPSTLVTAQEIAKRLDRDIDICEGLDPHTIVAIARHGHVRSSKLSSPVDPNKLSRDQRTEVIDRHIQLLAADPLHFATWHSRSGFSQWHVEFEEIAKHMIQHEIENTISARKGSLGVKLIRTLKKKGKLDERATCNAMMMSANDVRGIVNDLTVQGFVQTQEIPKVERREAKLSLHFVWYDRQRAREKLLHDTYKGMVRILQRIAYEREKVQHVLSKAERSDVVGKEDKYLSAPELDILRKWKEVQEKLVLQLFREDDLVATLRDFHGALISV